MANDDAMQACVRGARQDAALDVNDQPTPLDALADALLRGPIGGILPAI